MQVALNPGQSLGAHYQEAGGTHRERSQEPLERSIQEQGGLSVFAASWVLV